MAGHTRAELVYWEQNGKVEEAEVEWEVLLALINAGTQCGTWIEGRTPYGYWYCKLYTTPDGVYLIKEWIPALGYSWSEREVWKLKI